MTPRATEDLQSFENPQGQSHYQQVPSDQKRRIAMLKADSLSHPFSKGCHCLVGNTVTSSRGLLTHQISPPEESGRVSAPAPSGASFKDVRGPLPQVKLTPTGGVNIDNLGEFLKAGAVFVGVGSALVSKSIVAAKDWAALTRLAADYIAAAKAARAN